MDMVDPTGFLVVARERRKLLMRSQCEIRRPDGERVFDPETGTYSDPGHTVVYAGICQFRTKSTASPAKRETDVGEAELVSEAYAVAIPYDAPFVQVSDDLVITESDDAWAVARGAFKVGWVEYADNKTCRWLIAFAQDRPAVNDG